MKKMPPIEKVYEAYSAIADGRVTLVETENRASVASSDGAKAYAVTWNGNIYTSNDNASYWQGYPGYPVLAALMLQGKLTLDRAVADLLAGVNWAELNHEYKRNYAAAVEVVIEKRRLDAATVKAAVNRVYEEIAELDITIKRGALRPPKATD